MPFNLTKVYNQLLELDSMNEAERKVSLKRVFNRDFIEYGAFTFNQKEVTPTPTDGEIKLETLFSHLTTVKVDPKTNKREYCRHRSVRLHWVKFHLNRVKQDDVLVFSVKEPDGDRTYIYDKQENYVVILEPLRNRKGYYLLTAYYIQGRDAKRKKFEKKYKRRLNEVL